MVLTLENSITVKKHQRNRLLIVIHKIYINLNSIVINQKYEGHIYLYINTLYN